MNQLKTKIDEVKEKLGLTQMQLSERIGKNPYYLDTVKHRGVTTERQEELIRELDFVMGGGIVETPTSLAELLDNEREVNRMLREDNHALALGIHTAKSELDDAQRQIDSLTGYKRQYRDLVATVIVIGIIVVLGLAIWSAV